MKYDVLLKALFRDAMPALLKLLGLPPVEKVLTVEFFKNYKVMPDLVILLQDGRILHVELQSRNDPKIRWRCLEYWLWLTQEWPDAEIVQVVIYCGSDRMTMTGALEKRSLSYQFTILNLQEVPAEAFLHSEGTKERMLAALCESDDPRATIASIVGSWKGLPPKALRENLEDLCVLSQLRKRDTIAREEAARMPIELDITENAFYKAGEERGEAKGEARGEARGEAKGEAKVVVKFLERQFGPLPESTRKRIFSATVMELDRWADKIFSAASLEDVFSEN